MGWWVVGAVVALSGLLMLVPMVSVLARRANRTRGELDRWQVALRAAMPALRAGAGLLRARRASRSGTGSA